MMVTALLLMSVLLPAPSDSAGASTASPVPLRVHQNGFGVWAGGSLFSTTLIARTEGARFGLLGLQYTRVLATEGTLAVQFMADVIPAAVLAFPALPRPAGATYARAASPVYGVGLAPAGLRFIYRTDRAVQPFFGGSGGLMAFPHAVPDGRGRKLNYTFDIQAGVRWVLGPGRVLTIGYRFHHLSNGFRGAINPGFDANIFYLGFSTQ